MDTLTLQTLADFADLIGGVAVLGGVIFAVWQIRQYRQQRRDAAAIEIVRSLLSREFIEAFRFLTRVPDGISLKALRERGQEYEDAAIMIGAMGETIGFSVYQGVLPIEIVREQAGGLMLTMWRKLSVWAEQVREEQSYERWVEWWQWLADRLREDEESLGTVEPAYRRFPTRKKPRMLRSPAKADTPQGTPRYMYVNLASEVHNPSQKQALGWFNVLGIGLLR